MLGMPGAGKGAISQRLAEKFKIPQISTGDIIRKEVEKKSEIGLAAEQVMNQGKLLSDNLILEVVKNRLEDKDCEEGFIMDGFPRTIRQAEEFDKLSGFDIVFNFTVSEDTVIKRVCSRRICENCKRIYNTYTLKSEREGICDICSGKLAQRKDDSEEVMIRRLEVYNNETMPLVEFYTKKGNLIEIDAEPSVDIVLSNVVKYLEEFHKK